MSDIQKNNRPNVPNLRFPEFSGEWKKIRVSDLLEFFSTNSLSWDQLEYGGTDIFNLHYGLIHSGLSTQISLKKSILPSVKSEYRPRNYTLCEDGDVAFADASEDTNEVGKVVEFVDCAGKEIVCGLHTIHGRDKLGKTVVGFKGYAFSSPAFHNQIRRIAQGTKIFSINTGNFEEIFIGVPQKEEQDKISHLLSLLDQRIAIQNRIIEKYESLIKAIRLRVFSEILSEYECKQAIIADVLQYEQPAKYIVNSTEYLNDSSLTPVLTANKAFILGYTDETSGIYKKGECIILDDFTLDCKMVDFPFKVKSSAIKILTPRAGMNLRYIYEYLNYLELETTEHKRHYITEIEPMTIAIPEPNIIERIADVFNLLNGRLSCSKELLQTFLLLKRHILHQMFI